MWDGKIEPASIDQIKQGRKGKTHVLTRDAGGIAEGLKRIDPALNLRYSEGGDYYVVYHEDPVTHRQYLVSTYQTLDARIVEDIERIAHENQQPGYNYADALEKANAEADKARDAAFSEQIGDAGERLKHALRNDLGHKGPVSIQKDVNK